MDQNDRDQFGGEPREEQGSQGSPGVGDEEHQPTGTTGRDSDLQKEGNLGNERNRNEPDSERQPGGNRENLNR